MHIRTLTAIYALFSIVILSSCHLASCPNEDAMKTSIKELAEKSAESKEAKSEEQFYTLMNDCYKHYQSQLSLEDKREIWINALEFYTNKYDGRLDLAFEDAKVKLDPEVQADLKDFLKQYPEELMKRMTKNVGGIIGSLGKILGKFGKELESNAKTIEESLEKGAQDIEKQLEESAKQIEEELNKNLNK